MGSCSQTDKKVSGNIQMALQNQTYATNGSIEKYKAKFVAHGFTQKEGINYDETFAPVAEYTTIKTIISLVVVFG